MKPMPDELRRFVLTSIPSVPYLEAALLFHGAPQAERPLQDVARTLYVSERVAAELLQALCTGGLLRPCGGEPPRFCYAPRDEPLARMMTLLALAYADDLVGITNLIHDVTQKSALRFADAFKLRKDS